MKYHLLPRILCPALCLLLLSSCKDGQKQNAPSPSEMPVPSETVVLTAPAVSDPAPEPTLAPADPVGGIIREGDLVDLTGANDTSAYAFLVSLSLSPDEYVGKTLRLKGAFRSFYDEERDVLYMACFVSDATLCCAQGIYLLPDVRPSAESLPPDGAAVTVEGVVAPFTMEDGYETCRLEHAVMTVTQAP